ncbi:phosphoadenosine phosphosulfate reductase domain-containing protein [Zobellia laminariae]|uniref:Phosphoadenosine phosphosulfate reductase family protein n=1 Tax=Zobellia barbeyronii TaxID=2748009 RepID=A0ABS5WF43_9FLAO|nr:MULTISPECIES: phosphoadenosine phosphosulfate reductase family protein [Zobellia]MBT2162006.1 phosphoadenosine phosphosulfate reductase family protein [Zobellia barbeyronii]MUH41958.1 phosphoadenylylsulfate reductase [Zobellia laminariae]WKX77286.1 phosphoadenosine phosphosulfate reductase family protein [Zobellia laminariae]
MSFSEKEIQKLNERFKEANPSVIIDWAIENAKNAVVTTNFRPYEVAILNAVADVKNDIPVIWCDTGYNTPNTYKHAEEIIEKLGLNIDLYVPKQTSAHRDSVMGIPQIDDPKHAVFTEQVKLEPFKRAMAAHKPDVWFTNLRKGQTALRDSLDILSVSRDGVLKVSPFYHWSDAQLDAYLEEKQLPNEHKYFDPTKVLENRECGLHT